MSSVTNISAYRFAPLQNLKPLREQLYAICRAGNLKGTILLSTEGINLFVAGSAASIDHLLSIIRSVPHLESIEAKFSESADQPFTRMLVKIKKEIIPFGVEGIDPARHPAPRLTPAELKRWLDEGKPVTLLDTRNNFEVDMGTFRGAVPISIDHFREFPKAAEQLPLTDHSTPIVTFCTGGIRCEKAAPYLIQLGFQNVFQLDGGILKYFEECGGAHYQGECFVFDKRVGVTEGLHESKHGFCHVCQQILTPEDLDDPRTVEGVSCPHCYRSPVECRQLEIEKHRQKLQYVTQPLPGSTPIDNYRPLKIHARHDQVKMLDFLMDVLGQFPRETWEAECQKGNVVDGNRQPVSTTHLVQTGQRYYTVERWQIEPDVNPSIEILSEDDALIVINKPAPLPTHASGRYHRNTLEWILRQVYLPQKPRPAHRLDANTTGVILFTRTSTFARRVQSQFERGLVRKEYLARIQGHPTEDHFQCDASMTPVEGHQGARITTEAGGSPALTLFETIDRFSDGTSLVLVRPQTGRTNQIRVHLWHLGWPIVGDAMYLPDRKLGDVQTASVFDEPLSLHAWRLTIIHPQTGQPVTYTAPPPAWASRPTS